MIGLLVGLASCPRGSWLSRLWKALVLMSEAGAEVHRAGSQGRKGDGKWGREEALLWPLSLVWVSDTSQALCHGPNPTPGRSWRRVLGGAVVGYSPSLLPTSGAAGDRPCASSRGATGPPPPPRSYENRFCGSSQLETHRKGALRDVDAMPSWRISHSSG